MAKVRWWAAIGWSVVLTVAPPLTATASVDHTAWDRLLRRHVDAGLVDYAGLREEQEMLARYLASLEDVDPEQVASRAEQLAFWINAYNACVLKGVLNRYPLKSVKEIQGFFNKDRYIISNEHLTLDEIERKAHDLGDFRSHFAVVCASKGCPPLRAEAYVPERLDAQLDDQARLFLSDHTRGTKLEGQTLWLSKIFKWAKRDFIKSKLPPWVVPDAEIVPAIMPYLDTQTSAAIRGKRLLIKFLDYDWSLNVQRSSPDR